MSDTNGTSKRLLLYTVFISIAVNVFMLGFVAARLPMGGHPEFMDHPPHHHGPGEPGGPDGFGPGGPSDPGGPYGFGGPGGPGGPDRHAPFIGGALFSPQEMEADHAFMDGQFEKIRELRKQFAVQLASKDLTPETIRDHFAQTDKLMDELHAHLEQKTIDKIVAMTPEERKHLAEELQRGP